MSFSQMDFLILKYICENEMRTAPQIGYQFKACHRYAHTYIKRLRADGYVEKIPSLWKCEFRATDLGLAKVEEVKRAEKSMKLE